MGISAQKITELYPVLFHMAAARSWSSIRRHGLLSTSALLDLFEVDGDARRGIEEHHRPESVTIRHALYGQAVVRDQKPMSDVGLKRALPPGFPPRKWYLLLNSKVFFWVTEDRLKVMMKARAYRNLTKTVLHVDTAALLHAYSDRVTLAPMNTGCTQPFPHPRSTKTFQRLDSFPFEERRHRGRDAIVELAVDGGVPDIVVFVKRVEEVRPNGRRITLWAPGGKAGK